MTWLRFLTVLGLGWVACTGLLAADRVVKVLPHYLDLRGRHALAPSLFERDAYQAILRAEPEKRGGMRFDTQWKAAARPDRTRLLRLELVTIKHPRNAPLVIEHPLPPRKKSGWTGIPIEAATARDAGDIVAWRVSLVINGTPAASQQSFLW